VPSRQRPRGPLCRCLPIFKVLVPLTLAPIRGQTHADRLESFYRGQAAAYDAFRAKLLHGRRELWEALPVPDGGGGSTWVAAPRQPGAPGRPFAAPGEIYLVDLSPSLLAVARRRIADHGWNNVEAAEADATAFRPPDGRSMWSRSPTR